MIIVYWLIRSLLNQNINELKMLIKLKTFDDKKKLL
jgi:hypothetical protein